jgi:hypothetical protein
VLTAFFELFGVPPVKEAPRLNLEKRKAAGCHK